MAAKASGYSGTPLAKKLGIAPGSRVGLGQEPDEYLGWLAPLPDGVEFVDASVERATVDLDLVHLFHRERANLEADLKRLRGQLPPATPVWVSWPKRTAKLATDLTEDVIRDVALPLGYVDVKVCAVSEVWSGLKLVVRKALR